MHPKVEAIFPILFVFGIALGLPLFGFCECIYTANLNKSIRNSLLGMLLSLFYLKTIHKWINFTFYNSFIIISTFFWILRLVSYCQSISKHTHFFFTYAVFAFLLKAVFVNFVAFYTVDFRFRWTLSAGVA
jgi:hypothetical protein